MTAQDLVAPSALAPEARTAAALDVVLDLVVAARTLAASDVVVLDLRDPTGAALPSWRAGAHIDLLLAPDLVRQYSLCGDVTDPAVWRIAVLLEGRGSTVVHGLAVGSTVRVRGPRNNFALEPADRYEFIAGGIGITPLLPMLAEASAPWRLTYGGRAFTDSLVATYGDRVVLHDGLIDLGLLDTLAPGTLVYCCGPASLLDAVEKRCADGSLRVERFTPVTYAGAVSSFEVELVLSGVTLTVPAHLSVLEVLEKHGVDVLSSCREGTCGTCETAVLDGVVDHRDSLLTPAERAANDTMFVCVSRAACAKLVLER